MASLLDIRKKITGVKNTRKITKAMQLVATSKMKVFQKKAVSTRHFVHDLLNTLDQNISVDNISSLQEKRKEGKTLFVLYSSDKGLCGALNLQLSKALIRSDKWKSLQDKEKMLITIGRKAHDFARINNIKVVKHFTGIPENVKIKDLIPVIDEVLKRWNNKECKEVIFVVPHYFNTFTFYPKLKTFLPFSREMVNEHIAESRQKAHQEGKVAIKDNGYMIYEPDKERVVEFLFMQVIQGIFIQSFFELKASEYSSRMLAMQNATDAADKITLELTRVYNKTRQQAITQQLAELIGASEAV